MSLLSMTARELREPQAGFVALASLKKPWVESFILRAGRTIPRVRTALGPADRFGSLKARWGIGRMDYAVLPGIYAVGEPSGESAVFVSANYKMSFDALRAGLSGMDAWILVLDTKGVNVWCAAGKGSFGTEELLSRISKVKLAELVSHRNLVLPQLGAPGVSAPELARKSGFRVLWGPVRARDIPAWIAAGRKKDEAMRKVSFTLRERLAIAPIELVRSWPIIPAALLLGGLYGIPFRPGWTGSALPIALMLLGIIPVGTLLFPALLPWLPFRAFSAKGAVLGAAWAAACALFFRLPPLTAAGGALLAAPAVAFLAMNFTGSSTYTCQPGARMEVDRGFWPMVASAAAGLAAGSAAKIMGI